jgi:Arc/MetJ family transcription regulator
MRTNIEIDDELMRQAMEATGTTTKKAAVEAALQKVVQIHARKDILKWFGKIEWDGDLDAMRESRFPEWHGLTEDTSVVTQEVDPLEMIPIP